VEIEGSDIITKVESDMENLGFCLKPTNTLHIFNHR